MSLQQFAKSPALKAILLLILVMVLQLPFAQVRWLVQERQQRASEAQTRVSAQWSGQQTLAPAFLRLRFDPKPVAKDQAQPAAFTMMVMPDSVQLKSKLMPEVRRIGIFSVPVYLSTIDVSAEISDAQYKSLLNSTTHTLSMAQLRIEATDLRGVRGLNGLTLNGASITATASNGAIDGLSALQMDVSDVVRTQSKLSLRYQLSLAGSDSFKVLATARDTKATISGQWASPGFDQGAFLPRSHKINVNDFSAEWQVLEFNRPIPAMFEASSVNANTILQTAFGTRLVQQADHYQQNERIAKYGSLLLVLLFATLFLFEIIGRMRLHAIQYGLIGLSLATFYVLLLALSEHIGFGRAYLIASAASILVIGGYAMAIFSSRSRGMVLAFALALAYGFFYVLAAAEVYALLIGALGLFVLLAAVMYLTRNQDWRGESAVNVPPVPIGDANRESMRG